MEIKKHKYQVVKGFYTEVKEKDEKEGEVYLEKGKTYYLVYFGGKWVPLEGT